ncbi:dexamethasone-induced Ras-related protein 1-like [Hyperolius riggenbachi]|uniref:dexamethasone-induced Ras-related protein 1-like n=1 Tax=Hyperolius riggenbachi TaxID=752182 RepID=UPI0035A3CF15
MAGSFAKHREIATDEYRRLLVLGSLQVGKSSIVTRFLDNHFNERYTLTVEKSYRKYFIIRGTTYTLEIIETSPIDPKPLRRRVSTLCGDIFLLVFSLDDHESFDYVLQLKQQITELQSRYLENAEVPLMICGNKKDRDFCRKVQLHEIEPLVGVENNCSYFEVSAKTNCLLNEMFQALFSMAKLPKEMNFTLHRNVSFQFCEILDKKSIMGKRVRKDGDAYGMVDPSGQSPSMRSDLMYVREKATGGGQSKDKERRSDK